MSAIQSAIQRLVAHEDIDEDLAREVAQQIFAGEATPSQIGSFLTGLRIRGERPEHIVAFARAMRHHAAPAPSNRLDRLVDTCGTGGDSSGTFNISTAAAIVAAGAGVPIAKHGNRAVTGKCGSADVLAALGVNVEMTPETAARCLEEVGITFLFAPSFHAAMRHAGPVRREIAIRTIFNMLGPLSNPAGAPRQLVGVYDSRLTTLFAEVLAQLGSTHVMVVHGSDGLDEITLTGPTRVAEAKGGEVKAYDIAPEDFGIARAEPGDLRGGDAAENAEAIRAILRGEKGPKRSIVELNAAAALVVGDAAKDIREGVELASGAIDSGAAARALDRLVAASRGNGS